MYVLSRQEMYAFDQYTITKLDIPAAELMENAGRGCAEFIRNELLPCRNCGCDCGKSHSDSVRKIAVFCGAGNNGGDGFVVARYLKEWDYFPIIFLLGDPEKMSPETLENYQSCRELAIPISLLKRADFDLSGCELIVDAIFGIGLKGTVSGWLAELIEKINQTNKTVVAIDIASGIDADTGQAEVAINADFTLTMAAYKYGHFLGKGREKSGETLVVDIGIPQQVFAQFPPQGKLVTAENVLFPSRSRFSHKGDYGRVGIIAGSDGFSGAAIMASRAALRSGAGLITLFHPAGMELIFETQLLEVMTYSLPDWTIMDSPEVTKFKEKLNTMDALLIGPGIGTTTETVALLKDILTFWQKPLVLDADALNILAQNRELLSILKNKQVILTPHIGEFARLSDKTIEQIQADPLQALAEFYHDFGIAVLLKSATTIFYDGESFTFNISGNDGLSTGGSGDVLAGIIISFLAQKLAPKEAATSASYLLGETAEKLAEIRSTASIIPSDIIENLFVF
ncbi:MAG TPA: NAD(P)H-hydrate dehydratase [Candidatus Cloacimonadota bacterium]|nr:NAD(P)H-hydrate dehydratase [Candidatus Cloacimonadota bacterium]